MACPNLQLRGTFNQQPISSDYSKEIEDTGKGCDQVMIGEGWGQWAQLDRCEGTGQLPRVSTVQLRGANWALMKLGVWLIIGVKHQYNGVGLKDMRWMKLRYTASNGTRKGMGLEQEW